MGYVSQVLQPGETLVYITSLHWLIYWRALMLLVVAGLLAWLSSHMGQGIEMILLVMAAGVAAVGLGFGLAAFIRRRTTELAVTDQRVIYKSGVFGRHTLEINRSKVESVDVDQSIAGRILGYGTVIVRGTGGSLEPIRHIASPLTFRNHITAN